MYESKNPYYYGPGRRKSSVARVWISAGKGEILVNGVAVEEYMPYATLVQNLKQPLTLTGAEGKYDIHADVNGGGLAVQNQFAQGDGNGWTDAETMSAESKGNRQARYFFHVVDNRQHVDTLVIPARPGTNDFHLIQNREILDNAS